MSRRDVLVALAALLLIPCLLLPWLLRTRNNSRRHQCEMRQASLSRAATLFDEDEARLPGYRAPLPAADEGQAQAVSWVFPLLPYLADARDLEKRQAEKGERPNAGNPHGIDAEFYRDLYARYGPGAPAETQGKLPAVFLPVLVCPDHEAAEQRKSPLRMNYVVNSGLPDAASPQNGLPPDWRSNGPFLDAFPAPPPEGNLASLAYIEDRDGLSQTILLSENLDAGKWTDSREALVAFVWDAPPAGEQPAAARILAINQRRGEGNGSIRFARPSSFHAGGVNAAIADGSVRFISQNIAPHIFARLMSPDDTGVRYAGTDEKIAPPYRREP